MKAKTIRFILAGVLFVCTQLQAQVLYETDYLGEGALADWATTDDAWTHDPVAGTLTVAGAPAASAAYYQKLALADFTVTADVEVNNSAAAVVARFASLTDPFYMCRYHPQNAILQLYLINPTALLASLPLVEMPEFDPAQTSTVSITVEGNSVTGSLAQGDVTYSVQALDDSVTSGFGGMRVWGPGENVFSRFEISGLSKAFAEDPMPANMGKDVPRQVMLNWTAGEFARTHNVYLGTSFSDVNDASVANPLAVLVSEGQDATSLDAGRLDFGKTYYWRVDEVNGAPDNTVFAGEVWRFEVEPYSTPISGSTISVTASSTSNEFSTPDKMVDGSGLDGNGGHAIAPETMWFSAAVDLDPWIQFEFDGVKKLDVMTVWNSNGAAENAIGWGVKDLEIQYSADGAIWEVLADANQFSRAPGLPTYNQADVIEFKGAAARYVRLDIQSNWGGVLMSYGLSEVQFSMIPAAARTPEPASVTVDVQPDAVVTWRAGHEAAQHTVYVSTDMNAVADGLAPSVTSSTNSLDLTSMDLELGQTYYWRVDEVNEAEAVSVWAGPVWSFSTVAALVVDDFEGYTDASPNRPFQTWLDGFGYSADEFYPAGSGGNGTGSGVGHDIWSLSSPHYDGSIMEGTIARSGQSLPLYFDNSNGMATSETQRAFAQAQDWTVHGTRFMSLNIYGQPENTGQLYLKINDAKVTAERVNVAAAQWQTWTIELAAVNTDLTNVTTLTIGIEDSGAVGMLFVDDIKLCPAVSSGLDMGSERAMLNNGGALASQWIRSDNPEDVKGGAVFIGGLPSGADLRGLFAFSLAILKPGDVINNVTMSLFHGSNGTSNHVDGSIQSSRLELSLITNPAYANNGASWNNVDQDALMAWNTPGGDFGASLATVTGLDLTTIDANDEVVFNSTELTAAVQAAVDAGDSQIAFVLTSPDLEAATTRNFFVFQGTAASGSGSTIGPNLHVDLD